MKDKIIISIINLIDPKNKLNMNPIHLLLFMIIMSPIIMINWSVHPVIMKILAVIVLIQLLLFFLKLLVRDKYQNEINDVKSSVPSIGLIKGFNLFHLIMFSLIAAPFLLMIYGIVLAIFE